MRTLLYFLLILVALPTQAKTLTTKLFVDFPGYELTFESLGADREIKYKPNVRSRLGLDVSYGWIAVGGGFKLEEEDEELARPKGDTDYQDWRFSFNWDNWRFHANYQEYQGFYIENSTEVDTGLTEADPFIQKPNMTVAQGSFNVLYIWDPKSFSIRAALDQTERQTTSGGSWILGGGFQNTHMKEATGLIHSTAQTDFGKDQTITRAEFSSLNIKGGYGYTLVFGDSVFASLALVLGTGVELRKFKTDNGETEEYNSTQKGDAFLSLGYNGDDYFSGATLIGDATTFKTNSIRITSSTYAISIFFGRRF